MEESSNLVALATELTIAWLGNSNTRTTADDVPAFLQSMHRALAALGPTPVVGEPEQAAPAHTPAVSARKSLASLDHIVSMIDGKPYRTLRRHLATHGLTPAQYIERFKLKPDYPMVAPAYSEARRAMAKKIGLGRKPGERRSKAASTPASASAPAKPPRGRRKSGTGTGASDAK